jgi:ferredoxin
VDYEVCMGCGVCVSHCPQDSISLLRDPAKGEPLEIQKLIAHAAQLTQAFPV